MSDSVSCTASGSFLTFVPSLLAIITQLLLVNNARVYKSLLKQSLTAASFESVRNTPLFPRFPPYFCFSNKHESTIYRFIWQPIHYRKAAGSRVITKNVIKHLNEFFLSYAQKVYSKPALSLLMDTLRTKFLLTALST